MLNWFIHSILNYLLLAIGIGLCLYLFVSLQRQIAGYEARTGREFVKLNMELSQLRASVEQQRARPAEPSTPAEEAAPALAAARPGMNLNKRTQAVRMYRRGEKPEQIASALGLSTGEVELLLKIQQTVSLKELHAGIANADVAAADETLPVRPSR